MKTAKQGLTSKEWKEFSDLKIKANREQLAKMSSEIMDERLKRLPL
jgi:hypothetical protein